MSTLDAFCAALLALPDDIFTYEYLRSHQRAVLLEHAGSESIWELGLPERTMSGPEKGWFQFYIADSYFDPFKRRTATIYIEYRDSNDRVKLEGRSLKALLVAAARELEGNDRGMVNFSSDRREVVELIGCEFVIPLRH